MLDVIDRISGIAKKRWLGPQEGDDRHRTRRPINIRIGRRPIASHRRRFKQPPRLRHY
jgi:hypothetical protein